MLRNIRIPVLAIALTLACAPMATAFPPCPLDDTLLVPLGQSSSGLGASSWQQATYSHAGSIAPVRVKVPCQPNFPEVLGGLPRTGQCDEDVLMLDDLPRTPSSGGSAQGPEYSKDGWVGFLGLPELRLPTSLESVYEYTFTLAVNTSRMAHPGDWVDIAEMTFARNEEDAPTTTYRLRKILSDSGSSELHLIAYSHAQASGVHAHDIVAIVPMDKNKDYQNIAMRWTTTSHTRHPPPLGGKPVVLPPSEYVIDTHFVVTAGANVIHQNVLEDQMPDDLSMGVLAYNLPLATDSTSTTAASGRASATTSETTAAEAPPIPGMYDPGRALIFPIATLRSRRI